MIAFECGDCKAKIEAPDDQAGKTMFCPKCYFMLLVPNAAQHAITAMPVPARRPHDDADLPSIRRDVLSTWFRHGLTVFVAFVLFTILVALLLPARSRVRDAPVRTQSTNNLKEIGLAFHAFHDAHKRLPFNGSDVAVGDVKYSAAAQPGQATSGSWAFQVLPFIEHAALFNRIDRTKPVAAFMCPGRSRPAVEEGGGAWTDYFYNNYLNDPAQASKPDLPDRRRELTDITDGASNTIIAGHGAISKAQYGLAANVTLSSNIYQGGTFGTMRAGNDGTRAPGGAFLRRDSDDLPTFATWGGPFPQGCLMCMGDAVVRIFPYSTTNLSSFLTPSGNEVVTLPDA